MDESTPVGPEAGPSIAVEITPRDYRRRGLVFLTGGLLLTVVSVWLDVHPARLQGNPVLGVAAVGYGVRCLVQARRQVTRTLLRIDRSGIRSDDGLHDQTWDGVALVWVGSSTGLRLPFDTQLGAQPVLSLFTYAGLDFAARAGTRPSPRYSVPVGPPWTVGALSRELRLVTGATVVSGHEVSRRGAAAELRDRDQRRGRGRPGDGERDPL